MLIRYKIMFFSAYQLKGKKSNHNIVQRPKASTDECLKLRRPNVALPAQSLKELASLRSFTNLEKPVPFRIQSAY